MKASIPFSLAALILSVASIIHSYRVPSSLDREQIQKLTLTPQNSVDGEVIG